MTCNEILEWFEQNRSEYNIAGMKRFGIESEKIFGVKLAQIEYIRKIIKRDHPLALELWDTRYHEARHLAALLADPKIIEESTIDKWVSDFDNWAVCDSVCGKLFIKTEFAYQKVEEWQSADKLYVKRAAFAMIAWIALHHKKLPDNFFDRYFDLILQHATDDRNYIKKAVNWALRQIGKRNPLLSRTTLDICDELVEIYPESKSARWIAADARRELNKKYPE